jgi:hypothetical protein
MTDHPPNQATMSQWSWTTFDDLSRPSCGCWRLRTTLRSRGDAPITSAHRLPSRRVSGSAGQASSRFTFEVLWESRR